MTRRAPRPIADAEVAAYAAALSSPPSERLEAIATSVRAWSDYPAMMIDPGEARLLAILVGVSDARRILEIGTFGGYSAGAMLEALPADGRIDTLELDPVHAARAREHLDGLPGGERVVIHEGPALDTLSALEGPYDMAFIDADKPGYPAYFAAVVPLMRRGGLIVADNVLRSGRVLDTASEDPGVVAMRRFNEVAATDPRVETVVLTVRDGVSLIRVR